MSVWPDLAKFRHLGKIKKVIGIFSGFISYLAELKKPSFAKQIEY